MIPIPYVCPITYLIITRKPCYRKKDRAMRLTYGCPENFRESLSTPTATFPEIVNVLLLRSIACKCVQNLKFVPEIIGGTLKHWIRPHSLFSNILVGFCSDGPCEWFEVRIALPVPEIIAGTYSIGQSWIRPRSFFSKIFNGLLFGWTVSMYPPNLKSVALPVPEIIWGTLKLWAVPGYAVEGHPWSKVIDFGTNRKRVYICDFLLVLHSNLGPILHRFGDIAGFLRSWVTQPLFHPNFGVFPLHQIAHVGSSLCIGLKLFDREIVFEEFQPVWSRYLNVTEGRTERTDNILWNNRALRSIAR